jgi:alpha-amylase
VQGGFENKTRKHGMGMRIKLARDGHVNGLPVTVEKTVTFGPEYSGFDCELKVTNRSSEEINSSLGLEFNFSLLVPDAPDRYYEIPGHQLGNNNFRSTGELNIVGGVNMVDEWLGYEMGLKFSRPATLWRFPVETVSLSEAGFERVYQGSSVMPIWRIALPPGKSFKASVGLTINKRENVD